MVFIQPNFALTHQNTLQLTSICAAFARVQTLAELQSVLANTDFCHLPRSYLGGGSNVIFAREIKALVIQPRILGREILHHCAKTVRLRLGAGENWHDVVQWTLAQGWRGLENLALIPGTVGATPIQNIGAYGVEICTRIAQVEVFDTANQTMFWLDKTACQFDYRDSIFKQDGARHWVILRVDLVLDQTAPLQIHYGDIRQEIISQHNLNPTEHLFENITAQQIANAVIAIRQRKLPDPNVLPNAGSFFKNPIIAASQAALLREKYPALPIYPMSGDTAKLAAGWLIEQTGWKGKRLGAVGMHDKQALVLVNYGGASADDVWHLAHTVQDAVHEQFGVTLEAEPINFA